MDKYPNNLIFHQCSFIYFLAKGKELLVVAKTPNFTKNCWRMLLVDEVAEKLCWKGTEEKKSVRSLSVGKAIRSKLYRK